MSTYPTRHYDALSLTLGALQQHPDGSKILNMRIAANGPTIREVIERALAVKPGTE